MSATLPLDSTLPPHLTTPAAVTGCWSNFVDGASRAANWCGRTVTTVATAVWGGIQKIASLAVTFFQRAAYHISVGFNAAVSFVKANSSHFVVGGLALAVGIGLTLLFTHIFGCCNAEATAADLPAAQADLKKKVAAGETSNDPIVQGLIEGETVAEMAEAGDAVNATDVTTKTKKGAATAPVSGTAKSALEQRGLKTN